jgi:hypothetical protein
VSSASEALPFFTLLIRAVFAAGISQTLASYLSTHTGPTCTLSNGHGAAAANIVQLNKIIEVKRDKQLFITTPPSEILIAISKVE